MRDTPFMQEMVSHTLHRMKTDVSFCREIYAFAAATPEGRLRLARIACEDPSPEIRSMAEQALTAAGALSSNLAAAVRNYPLRYAGFMRRLAELGAEVWTSLLPRPAAHESGMGHKLSMSYGSVPHDTVVKGIVGPLRWRIEDSGAADLWLTVETNAPALARQVLQATQVDDTPRDDGGFLGLLALRPSDLEDGWWEGRLRIKQADLPFGHPLELSLVPLPPETARPFDREGLREYRKAAEIDDPAAVPVWEAWLHSAAVSDKDDHEAIEE